MIEGLVEFGDLLRGHQWTSLVLALAGIALVSVLWAAAERISARRRHKREEQHQDDDARPRDA